MPAAPLYPSVTTWQPTPPLYPSGLAATSPTGEEFYRSKQLLPCRGAPRSGEGYLPGVIIIEQRLAMVIPMITGTVKKSNAGPFVCRPLCEACLKISAGINYFQYRRANQGSAAPCKQAKAWSGKQAPDRMLAYGGMSKGRL